MIPVLVGAAVALVVGIIGTYFYTGLAKRKGWAQFVRADGPTSHHSKRGTPQMGGIAIFGSALAGYAAAHLVTWTFRYPDAPKANTRRIGLRLEPAAGGTTVHIDYSWERTYSRRRSAFGWVMAPLYRVVLAMQVARLMATLGAAVR